LSQAEGDSQRGRIEGLEKEIVTCARREETQQLRDKTEDMKDDIQTRTRMQETEQLNNLIGVV
jgi:hypothetical protein